MRSVKLWVPILASIPVTALAALYSFALAGVGHGSYSGFISLFPFSLHSAVLFQDVLGFKGADAFFVAPVFLQFPLYGLALGLGWLKGHLLRVLIVLSAVHILAVVFILAF